MSNFESHNEADQLEVFFKKHLHDVSIKPEKSAWDTINTALDFEEKEKRKKRFFWFFLVGVGVILISLSSLFFYNYSFQQSTPQPLTNGTSILNDNKKHIASNKQAEKNHTSEQAATKPIDAVNSQMPVGSMDAGLSSENNIVKKETVSSGSKITANTTVNPSESLVANNSKAIANPSENKLPIVKIQLGAFKRKVDPAVFSSVPLKVESETVNDITKYFVLSADVSNDLEAIKRAGFKDAFVKQNDLSSRTNAGPQSVANNRSVTKETHTFAGLGASSVKQNTKKAQNDVPANSTRQEALATNSPKANLPVQDSQAPANNPVQKQDNGMKQNEPVQNEPLPVKPVSQGSAKDIIAPQASVADVVTDSLTKKEAVVKTDSLQKEVKADSVNISSKTKQDTAKTSSYSRWALSVIGGPNVYFNNAKSTVFDPKTEKQPVTYSGELRAEYNFFKNFSAGAGVGYQYHTIQKDSTRFKFSKYISSDYIVNTSFGDLAIDHTTLMNGFYLAVPVDTFAAAYKYTSTIKSVNIPVYVNWYFINRPRIKAYSSIGVNANYIISQTSNITLIKEHTRDEFHYRNVIANRFNAILLLSLGCDIRVYKRFYFTAAPTYRYALTNYSTSKGVLFKPSYLSGTAGFKFRL